jgi:xanthine/CO dehydrogenase XdhC/CoxF family maturation factor
VQIARTASWHVTVADRRDRLASRDRFPLADVVLSCPWEDAVAAVRWTRWTSALLMTHSVEDDLALLGLLPHRQTDYVGVLGPSARTQRLWDAVPAEQREQIHSPVGQPLGEKSPPAVAVAIMAELIAHRRGRRPRPAPVAGKALA